ncbi:hypothetical protein BH11GEM2_BH11GEM2_31650 [soil metagenome]
MDIVKFIGTGLLVALAAGVLGTALVGLVEVARAYLDPTRREAIAHRNWRENLHHMLH